MKKLLRMNLIFYIMLRLQSLKSIKFRFAELTYRRVYTDMDLPGSKTA